MRWPSLSRGRRACESRRVRGRWSTAPRARGGADESRRATRPERDDCPMVRARRASVVSPRGRVIAGPSVGRSIGWSAGRSPRRQICKQLAGSSTTTWTAECLLALHLRRSGVQGRRCDSPCFVCETSVAERAYGSPALRHSEPPREDTAHSRRAQGAPRLCR